ncbi:MAG: serine/threonine-protein kinase, partial [Acidimicrobiales bacterium]|nr:serine/threonine-protein kinase [Acidimicrobiales bacterium]
MWRLGRFRVDDRPFASGATAEVFTARKGRAGPRVAVKVLPLKTYRERSEAEADVATIDHPRLLRVHERVVDERRGVVGLVMDLAAEGDLRTALRGGDEPTPSEMLQIADDVLAGLEALHAVGVLHRDVKPENVMLERVDGQLRARLGDLGIARQADRTRSTGSVLGTDLYIAPEVHDGAAPSVSADLWAVGYVLYEGLFGAPPHAGAATTYQAIGRLRAEGPDRPPNVPDSVWAVVARLLAPWPGNRPASAADARIVVASAREAAEAASRERFDDASTRRRKSAGSRRSASILQP